jgi:hypothetical protein
MDKRRSLLTWFLRYGLCIHAIILDYLADIFARYALSLFNDAVLTAY